MSDEQTGIKIADWFAGSRGLGSGSAALAEKITEALAEARKEALEEAAQLLEKEVTRHRAENKPHEFCEDYGCSSLEEFATAIRSLAAAGPDAQLMGESYEQYRQRREGQGT